MSLIEFKKRPSLKEQKEDLAALRKIHKQVVGKSAQEKQAEKDKQIAELKECQKRQGVAEHRQTVIDSKNGRISILAAEVERLNELVYAYDSVKAPKIPLAKKIDVDALIAEHAADKTLIEKLADIAKRYRALVIYQDGEAVWDVNYSDDEAALALADEKSGNDCSRIYEAEMPKEKSCEACENMTKSGCAEDRIGICNPKTMPNYRPKEEKE